MVRLLGVLISVIFYLVVWVCKIVVVVFEVLESVLML